MKRFVVGVIAAAALVSTARTATAQAKTVRSEMRTETAIVEAIEASTRTLTLKKPDGTFVTICRRAGHQAVRGAQGRRQGQRSVLRDHSRPAEATRRGGGGQQVKGDDSFRTGPAWWHQSQAADGHCHDHGHRHELPSITFTGPNGLTFTSKVLDTEALAKVKVGDKVDIVWTEAMLVSLEPGS